MKIIITVVVILLIYPTFSLSQTTKKPVWVTRKPRDTAKCYYFVSSAVYNPNKQYDYERAFKKVKQNVYNDVISRMFGVSVKSSFVEHQTESEDYTDKKIEIVTDAVRITRLNEIENYDEVLSQSKHRYHRLFCYPHKEYSSEKKRLASVNKNKVSSYNVSLTTIGDKSKPVGRLKITTTPPDAEIFLNGQKVGNSNYKAEKVGEGKYDLMVLLTGYKTERRKILISPGILNQVSFLLKKESGTLKLNSLPEASLIYINESFYGKTPKALILDVGKYNVKVESPDYFTQSQEVYIDPLTTYDLSIKLSPKPSFLSVRTKNVGIKPTVIVDGVKIGNTPINNHKINAEEHTITLKATGYKSSNEKIIIPPNKYILKEFSLKRGSDVEPIKESLAIKKRPLLMNKIREEKRMLRWYGYSTILLAVGGLTADFYADNYYEKYLEEGNSEKITEYKRMTTLLDKVSLLAYVASGVVGILGIKSYISISHDESKLRIAYSVGF